MAISTYADLKAAVTNWFMGRSDIAEVSDDMIDLTEGLLNQTLRCREMETVASLTPTNNVCALPSDYIEYKRVVELASIRRPLEYITESGADDLYPTRAAGLACNFMIIGNDLTALPLSSNNIELTYYQALPALAEDNQTNWLLTKFPNVYLHGCLMHAAEYVKNTEEGVKEGGLFQRYVDMLIASDNRAKFGNAGVTLSGPVW